VFSLTAAASSQWAGPLMPSLKRPWLAVFFGRHTHAGREPLGRTEWFPKPFFPFTQRRKHPISAPRALPIPNHRGMNQSKYPPAEPEALKTVRRSKRPRGRCRGPAKPLWSDGTARRATHYRSFRSLPVPPDSEGSQNSDAGIGTCLPNPRIRRPASRQIYVPGTAGAVKLLLPPRQSRVGLPTD